MPEKSAQIYQHVLGGFRYDISEPQASFHGQNLRFKASAEEGYWKDC